MTQLQTHKGKQMMKELQNYNHQINSGIWDLEATKISIKAASLCYCVQHLQ